MSISLRKFAYGILLLSITSQVLGDDPLGSLREGLLQVLDAPELSNAERIRALRAVLDENEATLLAEDSKKWVSALGSDEFDVRRNAREQLSEAGAIALPALEQGVRSSNLEVSTSCLQLIDRLARSDTDSENARLTLERLAKVSNEATASRVMSFLTAVRRFHVERQVQAATDRLLSVGCRVSFDERAPGRPVTRISIASGGGFDDSVLACVDAFPELEALHLHKASITDAGMVHVEQLRNLRRLSLSHSAVSDKGLAHIAELKGLEDLAIDDTDVTDEGLQHVMNLKRLKGLRLSGTQVTDNGLLRLKDLPNLTSLGLGLGGNITDDGLRVLEEFPRLTQLTLGTDFSDRGVEHLAGIANLERLAFINCKGLTDKGLQHLSNNKTLKHLSIYSRSKEITEEGVKELQRALPGLEIGGMR